MKNSLLVKILLLVILVLVVIGGIYIYEDKYGGKDPIVKDPVIITDKSDLIRVTEPTPNSVIKSSFNIKGQARGTWFFEASFPIKLVDANGKQIGVAIAKATSDWMTESFVPFEAQMEFTVPKLAEGSAPQVATGTLIFQKDNPSGLAEYDDELRVPVKFELSAPAQQTVLLYYYSPSKDKDGTGNLMCTKQGLVPVQRKIDITKTPIQDTIKLLLKGELTTAEKAQGITTEYPLQGFELKAASLNSGVLTLTFADPYNKSGGGSCRIGILWSQISETAKQFPGVVSVKPWPEELFQP
ncbi:MAG: hypothetical protein UT33_C0009G0048 [Candidatus Peregrinibacteria bacterium GW2011_GWC2_39_14]|nr:MAG: hypothetical protein US92_C0005G0048 [Candidatus Peregrinibacteria bacterium GW2011_GWA2_38_36]KKR06597.1 MAG: hypothetical protein UT33_C0009G0048 [Candidatus Peregrinibacteria bacterium GW2011_GWC2_39_14]